MINYTKTGKNRYILFDLIENTKILEGINNKNIVTFLYSNNNLANICKGDVRPIINNGGFIMFDYSGLVLGHPMSTNKPSYVVIDNLLCLDTFLLTFPQGLIKDIMPKLKTIRRKNSIAKILNDNG